MARPPTLTYRSWLSPLLALLLLFQLGAASCGCCEHNLWLGLLSPEDAPATHFDHFDFEEALHEVEDCDHSAAPMYAGGSLIRLVKVSQIEPLMSSSDDLPMQSTTTGMFDPGHSRAASAPPVRALHQVFLL